MQQMLYLSHATNIAVAGGVGLQLLCGQTAIETVYVGDSPASRILACVYLAIAICSLMLIGYGLTGRSMRTFVVASATLLAVQIIYKTATAAAVGFDHVVVRWNLAIATLHGSTMFAAWWSLRQ